MILKHSSLVVASSVVLAGLLSGCSTGKVPPGAPLDRVQEWHENPEYHVGNGDTLLEWIRCKTPETTVYNPEYRWPDGLATSMTPILVDWENSRWENSGETISSNYYILVRNVYVSGNPILGQTRLATIRIPARGVKTVEFVLVRYHLKGLAKTSGHVQLRFVFHENHRPQVLNADGSPDQSQPALDDLIFSWEAWRPSGTAWDFKTGLDSENYKLTARLFAGSQRFLQDALRGAVWDCYPLDLSAHEDAADTVLLTGLLMGDTLGRNLIWNMLEDGLIKDPSDEVKKNWKTKDALQARKTFTWEEIPEYPGKIHSKEIDPGYHALQRSCINLTLEQIDLAMERVYEKHNLEPRTRIHLTQETIPRWFDDVVEGNGWGTLYRAPHALFWLMGHKEVLPYKSYRPLEKAGVLQLDKKGKPIFYRYGHKASSPYGPLNEKIM